MLVVESAVMGQLESKTRAQRIAGKVCYCYSTERGGIGKVKIEKQGCYTVC